ncbi:DNRLRE domain-containing protein [Verrucomicrobiaceae bacterium N1E253]|uniref:DNRLRE domain-containing protein n=1 Tax=Oceaniferula marina TaxID=2748318 RepID=A0A851GBX2_9BACT|nr:DNRLRE domain-containing protein [Oceaniferula marina]NWK55238.1 DNRLRE domain-containing protein [Oceaniferula marina]
MKLLPYLLGSTLSVLGAQAATTVLTTTEDTYTQQNSSNTNYSTESTFSFGAPGNNQARSMLFRFDASTIASIPAADILSVTLELTLQDSTGSRRGFVGALVDGNADWTNSGATWNTRNGTNAWTGAAGARSRPGDSETLNSSFALTASDALNDTVISIPLSVSGTSYADFSQLFAEWNDGSNNGLVIYNADVSPLPSGVQSFYSSEATNAAFRPRLVVETVPEPTSAALLGLGGMALILRRRK